MLKRSWNGFGLMALSALMAERNLALGGTRDKAAASAHFVPRAKNVIFLFMDGGVSHVDSFDPKPELTRRHLEDVVLSKAQNPAGEWVDRKWLGSPWKFERHGGSGLSVSELFPHTATCADDLAVIRSMVSEFPLHSRANLFMHTGSNTAGKPSLGSWINYGLGSENHNLPGFVVLHSGMNIPSGMENFSNGFLPASYQATLARTEGAPIDNLLPADNLRVQRAKLDLFGKQDREFSASLGGEESIESAIANYELAYRMQSLVPDVVDLSAESEATKKLYGIDSQEPNKRRFAMECLRARRLVESGVRFVEVLCPNVYGSTGTWDQHGRLKEGHEVNAFNTDQATAGLIKDLKARGMLDDTLVLWSGEFGRTPHSPGTDGRDHHPYAFSLWMAGGGIKGGCVYGTSDELGMGVAENPVTIHDLHATILHLLGLDHERLTYHFSGRDFRLTDVSGRILSDIIA
jgi:hypothetical protein